MTMTTMMTTMTHHPSWHRLPYLRLPYRLLPYRLLLLSWVA
jgi:hypothetical protein